MKTLKLFLLLPFFFSQLTFADFINSDAFNGTAEEVIIDNLVVDKVSYEEPSFTDRRVERDIAQMIPENKSSEFYWQGQLVVVKEIPFTYSQINSSTIEARVLNEIEEAEHKAKNN